LKADHLVGKDDGRYVDEVDGHHVEVGVGVLPSRKKKMLFWIVTLVLLSTVMAI
jgi:hypothetical protein